MLLLGRWRKEAEALDGRRDAQGHEAGAVACDQLQPLRLILSEALGGLCG